MYLMAGLALYLKDLGSMNQIVKYLLIVFALCQVAVHGQKWSNLGPYFPLQNKGRVGLMNLAGETVIEPKYLEIKGFSDSPDVRLFGVNDENGWHIIYVKGAAFPIQEVEQIICFPKSGWTCLKENDHQFRLYSVALDSLLPEVFLKAKESQFPICQIAERQWRVYLGAGEPIEVADADEVESAMLDLCVVRRGEERKLHFYANGQEVPYLNITACTNSPKGWSLGTGKGQYFVVKEDMRVLGPFSQLTQLPWGLIVHQKWVDFGFVNFKGDTLIPCRMKNIYLWGNLLEVKEGETIAIFDSTGRNLTGFKFTDRQFLRDIQLAIYYTADSTFFLLQDGSIPLKLPLVKYDAHNAKLISVSGSRGFGVVNREAKLLVPPTYKKLRLLNETMAQVQTDSGVRILHFDQEVQASRRKLVIQAEDPVEDGDFNSTWNGRVNLAWRVLPNWGRNDSIARSRGWFRDPNRQRWGVVDASSGDTVIPAVISFIYPMPDRPFTVIERRLSNGTHQFGVFNDEQKRVEVEPYHTYFDWETLRKHGISRYMTDGKQWMLYELGKRPYQFKGTTYIPMSRTGEYLVLRGGNASREREYTKGKKERFTETIGGGDIFFSGGKIRLARWKDLADTKFDYDWMEVFQDNRLLFRNGKNWGVVDTMNKVLSDGYFKIIELKGQLLGYKHEPNIGFFDPKGDLLTDSPLQAMEPFSNGLAAFRYGGRWGMMNSKGNWVVQPIYDWALPFNDDRVCVGMGDSTLVLDGRGNFIFQLQGKATAPFSDGWLMMKEGRGWNYYSVNGEKMTTEKFSSARPFANGRAIVGTSTGLHLINSEGDFVTSNGAYNLHPINGFGYEAKYVQSKGWLHPDGTFWPIRNLLKVISATENGFLYHSKAGYGIANAKHRKGMRLKVDQLNPFSEGLAYCSVEGSGGYLNEQGEWAIPPQFEQGAPFKNGYAVVKKGNKYGVIDRAGDTIPVPAYSKPPIAWGENWLVCPNWTWELWTRTGQKTMLNIESKSITPMDDQHLCVKSNIGFSIWDQKGNEIRRVNLPGSISISPEGIKISNLETLYLVFAGSNAPIPIWEGSLVTRGPLTHLLINGESAYLDQAGNWVRKPSILKIE